MIAGVAGPNVLFGIAAAVIVSAVLPLAAGSIVRGHRADAKAEKRQTVWSSVVSAGVDCLLGRSQRAAQLVREQLDDKSTRQVALSAISTVLRAATVDVAPLRCVVSESRAPAYLRKEMRHGHTDRVVAALEMMAELCLAGPLIPEAALLTRHENEDVRHAAARALVVSDPALAISELLRLLPHEGPWVRSLLCDVVLLHPLQATLVMNAKVLHEVPELIVVLPWERWRGRQFPNEWVGWIEQAFIDERQSIRLAAVTAMGSLGGESATLALAAALGSVDRSVRFAAADRLSRMRGGIEILLRTSEKDSGDAAEVAATALLALAAGPFARQRTDDEMPDDFVIDLRDQPAPTSKNRNYA